MNESTCSYCDDEHYLLQGCCDGRECGCMGQPVSMTVCKECNADGNKPIGDYVASFAPYIEFLEDD